MRQYTQAGVLNQAEVEDLEDVRAAVDVIVSYNRPMRTLVLLLEGLHSVNIRTNKDSIYRIRFVAPGPPHGSAAMSASGVASTTGTPTSAAYPLLAMILGLFTRSLFLDEKIKDLALERQFEDLVDAEMDALDCLTTSDSSSATDTEWLQARRGYGNIVCYSHGTVYESTDLSWSNAWSQDQENPFFFFQQNNISACQSLKMEEEEQVS